MSDNMAEAEMTDPAAASDAAASVPESDAATPAVTRSSWTSSWMCQ